MSIPLVVVGATFNYPVNFDEAWGVDATGWAQAVTNGMLQRSGGNFPILADINFGSSFGLVSSYYKSRSSPVSSSGTIRLASADPGIAFRNNANSGNLILTTDASDNLLYNGHILNSASASPVLSITGTVNQVIASSPTGNITLSLPQDIGTASNPTFNTATFSSGLFVNNGSGVELFNTGNTQHILLAAPSALSTNYNLLLPTTPGLTGQILSTDGTGVTTWINPAGGGTVNSGTQYQIAYYPTTGTTISGNTKILTDANNQLIIEDTSVPVFLSGLSATSTLTANRDPYTGLFGDPTKSSASINLDCPAGPSDVQIFAANAVNTTASLVASFTLSGNTFYVPLAMGANKITGMANGTVAQDAVAFDQLTTGAAITTGGVASNTLTGSTANSGGSAGNVAQGTLSTPDFRTNAVTNTVSSVAGLAGTTGTTVTTATLTTLASTHVLITYSFTVQLSTSGGAGAVTSYILQDGAELTGGVSAPLGQGTSGTLRLVCAGSLMVIPTAGTHTYTLGYLQVTGTSFSVTDYSLNVIELRA